MSQDTIPPDAMVLLDAALQHYGITSYTMDYLANGDLPHLYLSESRVAIGTDETLYIPTWTLSLFYLHGEDAGRHLYLEWIDNRWIGVLYEYQLRAWTLIYEGPVMTEAAHA